jgi:hypothetical protein
MKYFKILAIITILLFIYQIPIEAAGIYKWANAGKMRARVFDNGHQSETESGTQVATYYFDGHQNTGRSFTHYGFRNNGLRIGVKNWKDQNGTLYPVRLSGAPYGTSDASRIMFVIPDAKKITIHKYMRYQPPSIVVDGMVLNDPFPFDEGDHVAPEKIPGTADMMIESHIRTWIGLDVHQRVFAWGQKNHDDYVVYELTFKNTGNVDYDDEIELPGQVLDSLYIMRSIGCQPAASRDKEWSSWYGCRPGDSLRIMYNYSCRTHNATLDDFGAPNNNENQLRIGGPGFGGEAMLFVSSAPNDIVNDNLAQPQMHTVWSYRLLYLKEHSDKHSPAEWAQAYDVMKRGLWPQYKQPLMTDAYPGTYHEVIPEEQGFKTVREFTGWGNAWHSMIFTSCGPFRLAFGDSIRIVYAMGFGSISKQKAFELGRAWYNKRCKWEGPDNLPPQYKAFPQLYSDENDKAKDQWVMTGKDSLFRNLYAAQWNKRQNYNIPVPPAPPSIEIVSLPDRIKVKWDGKETSEKESDFAGYRVYRTVGSYHDSAFVKVYECGKGTASPTVVYEWDDVSAIRGTSYYYYVTAFDDGVSNSPDFHGKKESLESGMFANMTTQPGILSRAAGTSLDDIRVVPNPFSLGAKTKQFPGDPNRIIFYNIPSVCMIRIFSESGDLVKTINHTSGSGDAAWGILKNEQQTTDTGQIPVSGIYIANIKTPDGQSKNIKFVIVR